MLPGAGKEVGDRDASHPITLLVADKSGTVLTLYSVFVTVSVSEKSCA